MGAVWYAERAAVASAPSGAPSVPPNTILPSSSVSLDLLKKEKEAVATGGATG